MRWALGATGLVVLSVLAVTAVVNGQPATTSAGPLAVGGSSPQTVPAQPSSGARSLTPAQQLELEQNISRMRGVVPVEAAESRRYPAVDAETRQQPDLYAAAFVRELLTQDYRTSRDQLLAWVQSESAQSTEPLVIGLTPAALRPAMAIASVQDGINGPSPVPTQNDWTGLAGRQGHTTVKVQHVSEPLSWASAVAKAQISDPGVTARQVDAEVTLQTTELGKVTTQKYSVALVINLEGPPVRDGYGFVAAITYNIAAAAGR